LAVDPPNLRSTATFHVCALPAYILGSKSKTKTALATWYDLNLPHFVKSPLLALELCQRSNPFQQLLTTWRQISASSPLAHLSDGDREFCSCTRSNPFQQLLTTWRRMSASSPLAHLSDGDREFCSCTYGRGRPLPCNSASTDDHLRPPMICSYR